MVVIMVMVGVMVIVMMTMVVTMSMLVMIMMMMRMRMIEYDERKDHGYDDEDVTYCDYVADVDDVDVEGDADEDCVYDAGDYGCD